MAQRAHIFYIRDEHYKTLIRIITINPGTLIWGVPQRIAI